MRAPVNDAPFRLIDGVVLDGTWSSDRSRTSTAAASATIRKSAPFVEIQRGVTVGANCKVQSHVFICEGVELEDEVFVGHGTLFTNDELPRATDESGALKTEKDWMLLRTIVERGASLGSGSIVMGGIRIGARAIVGAAVVTRDVGPGETVAGVPARARGHE